MRESSDASHQRSNASTAVEPVLYGFREGIGDLSKAAVGVAFVLYVLGYVIWNSYLGEYSASPLASAVRVEFLSAALCYTVLIAAFLLPMLAVWNAIALPGEESPAVIRHRKFLRPLIMLWGFLLYQLRSFYFGTIPMEPVHLLPILAVALFAMLFTMVGRLLQKRQRVPRWMHRIQVRQSWYVYAAFAWLGVFFTSVPNSWYFVTLLTLFVGLVSGGGIVIEHYWPLAPRSFRGVYIILCCILLLLNAREFARALFGIIPRSVGGGKPELAYVKLVSGEDSTVAWLRTLGHAGAFGITNSSTNSPVLLHKREDGFVGPLHILFRTGNEFLFTSPYTARATAKEVKSHVVQAVEYVK